MSNKSFGSELRKAANPFSTSPPSRELSPAERETEDLLQLRKTTHTPPPTQPTKTTKPKPKPKAAKPAAAKPKPVAPTRPDDVGKWAENGLPTPSVRRGGTDRRPFPVQLPHRHHRLLDAASKMGMSPSLLVLSTFDTHRETLERKAKQSGLVYPAEKWTQVNIRLSDQERSELDALAETVADALGRKSRSATVVCLLDLLHT